MTRRLLLDEMYSPEIAQDLVKRGYDVASASGDPAMAGLPDEQILELAAADVRCVVTENVKDFEMIRRAWATQGRSHAGLVYSSPARFPRDSRFVGALITALEQMLTTQQVPDQDGVAWLAPARR